MAESYIIRSSELSETEDLYKQLCNLLSTREGTIPINRDFGLNWNVLSKPIDEAESDFVVELMEKIETFIPELRASEVDFESDAEEGKLIPVITIERSGTNGG